MREIITTTGASLFTAGIIIAQAVAAPAPASASRAVVAAHATIPAVAR